MLDWNWLIKVEHICREGNRPADYLAGLGHTLPIGVHYVSTVVVMLFVFSCMTCLGFPNLA
ncbi:hypothetical protein LINGRAHAP2_LOCUS3713 [Linum grandiflorum]